MKLIPYMIPTHEIWVRMLQRCYDPYDEGYIEDIEVCQRWRKSFKNFLCDLRPKPEGFVLGRVNGKKNFCPSNCRWVVS